MEDGSRADLVVQIILVVLGLDLEAVEGRFFVGEGLAVWVMEMGIGGNVVVFFVAAWLREAAEEDVDGRDLADGNGHEGEADESNHVDGCCSCGICEVRCESFDV